MACSSPVGELLQGGTQERDQTVQSAALVGSGADPASISPRRVVICSKRRFGEGRDALGFAPSPDGFESTFATTKASTLRDLPEIARC
jgi:hypothetical protein